ncbi:MAG: hypothetical protein P8Y47_07400 [Alphaproteobacteria bacterium]
MNIPALLIGIGAASLLLLAGYLAGLWRGSKERTRLRGVAEQQAAILQVGSGGQRRDLSPLLDLVTKVGGFSSVLLSNEDGLVVASAGSAPDFDDMAAATVRLTSAADQFAANRGGALAVVIRDASDSTTLCRLFTTSDQTLALTATSNDTRLSTVALDPALAKIETALAAQTPIEG